MEALESFVKLFSEQSIPFVKRRDEYFTPADTHTDDPLYAGIRLGFGTRRKFRPSPALLDMIITSQVVVVNEKAAWLFLCGKNILKEGIVSGENSGYVIIRNERDEVLGYGKGTGAGVTNLFDRGDYLRRER